METTQVKTVNVSSKKLQKVFNFTNKKIPKQEIKVNPITGEIDLKYEFIFLDPFDFYLSTRISEEELWVNEMKKLINYRNNG